MGWNPVKEAEKKAKRAIDKIIKPAAESAKKSVNKVGDRARSNLRKAGQDIESGVKSAGSQCEDAIKKVGREAEDELRDVGRDIEDGLTDTIPELFDELIDEIAESIAKEGLKKTQSLVKVSHRELESLKKNKPDLTDAIDELGGTIEIGPMILAYANFYTRMEEIVGVLDHYINEPPSLRRRDIIALIKALGPDSVDLGISIQVVAVVVGSKELGFGGSLNDIGIELFAEIADAILEAAGVPD